MKMDYLFHMEHQQQQQILILFKNDLFCAIIAPFNGHSAFTFGGVFGGIEGGNETWIFSDNGYGIFYTVITHCGTKFGGAFSACVSIFGW